MHLRLAREIYREYQRQLWKPTASEVPAEFGERIKGDETSFTVLPSKGGQLGRWVHDKSLFISCYGMTEYFSYLMRY